MCSSCWFICGLSLNMVFWGVVVGFVVELWCECVGFVAVSEVLQA